MNMPKARSRPKRGPWEILFDTGVLRLNKSIHNEALGVLFDTKTVRATQNELERVLDPTESSPEFSHRVRRIKLVNAFYSTGLVNVRDD